MNVSGVNDIVSGYSTNRYILKIKVFLKAYGSYYLKSDIIHSFESYDQAIEKKRQIFYSARTDNVYARRLICHSMIIMLNENHIVKDCLLCHLKNDTVSRFNNWSKEQKQ